MSFKSFPIGFGLFVFGILSFNAYSEVASAQSCLPGQYSFTFIMTLSCNGCNAKCSGWCSLKGLPSYNFCNGGGFGVKSCLCCCGTKTQPPKPQPPVPRPAPPPPSPPPPSPPPPPPPSPPPPSPPPPPPPRDRQDLCDLSDISLSRQETTCATCTEAGCVSDCATYGAPFLLQSCSPTSFCSCCCTASSLSSSTRTRRSGSTLFNAAQ
ncbi:hypothetical protein C5167_027689 [Papaver somniferum]|uniref:mulatexin-like n=1 Tax=Papaver somniferum TaxID=3469 RepID=UPI000E703FAD|nr:mulatexin-like [Papaver somniferum]XP_026440849.1 mulatexin-like [Papaver somniferum]RZC91623.1 hypothetical protein C5167_027688 [Papaver somniferum]RZC91624.1 hypothetical protein C5167_027689 [Papaver somniferum]